jgi:hypothetical protein
MLLETIFVTRLLGLVAGDMPIKVETGPDVKAVQLQLDGKTVAKLSGPPWTSTVDFGKDLAPHELTAVAYDAHGNEVARDTQAVNLARGNAEVGVVLERKTDGVHARILPRHYAGVKPVATTITLDGQPVDGTFLGAFDAAGVHLVSVNVRFADGETAKKEVVFGGVFGEELPAELTPVIVREKRGSRKPCFVSGDQTVAPAAVEKGRATIFFIQNGEPGETVRDRLHESVTDRQEFIFPDVDLAVVDAGARAVAVDDNAITELFSGVIDMNSFGILGILLRDRPAAKSARVGDAVASSALAALRRGRRAIVLVVGEHDAASDVSIHSPATVRRYLERVGVPFRVWSLGGATRELEAQWGEVEDVSHRQKLIMTIVRLRRELNQQRVAWLPLPPYAAFQARTTRDCAYEMLAK